MDIGQIISVLTLFFIVGGYLLKRVLEKTIDAAVTSSFEKHLEYYRDDLSRAFVARKFMLSREMKFFDLADRQLAELIPLIQDLNRTVQDGSFNAFDKKCYIRYTELILAMKNMWLTYESYIEDRNVCQGYVELVSQMQEDAPMWLGWAEALSGKREITAEMKTDAGRLCDGLLKNIAHIRCDQRDYLKSI